MKRAPTILASKVLDVLCEKHFTSGPYTVLREVSNQTGYDRQQRFADGLVVSCWPSRGLWFGGLEVKVARNDWKRELADPEKSTEIQRFCTYWWIATPPDIVKPGELPETWGHIEVNGATCNVLKVAPKLEPEPPSVAFVASILRQLAKKQAEALNQARYSAIAEVREEVREDMASVQNLKNELAHACQKRDLLQRDIDALQTRLNDFERVTGLNTDRWSLKDSADAIKAARALSGFDLKRMALTLSHAAEALGKAQAELEAAKGEGAEVAAQ